MTLNAGFNRYFAAVLGGVILLAPISNTWAATTVAPKGEAKLAERCKGPCPNNADCICGPCDTPLVLGSNGTWSIAKVDNSADNSAACLLDKKNMTKIPKK